MKQIDDDKKFADAFKDPWFAIIPQTCRTLTNAMNSLSTAAADIKGHVRISRPQFRNSVLDECR